MKKQTVDVLLSADQVFTATGEEPFQGYVAVSDGVISAVGRGRAPDEWIGTDTRVYELGDKTICPGFTDVHCFFPGFALWSVGADLTGCRDAAEAVALSQAYARGLPEGAPVLGHGIRASIDIEDAGPLERAFGSRPVALFLEGNEACWMNRAAVGRYGFDARHCWSEQFWRLFQELLGDRSFAVPAFRAYMRMMNSRGITATKEVCFDDYYGFADSLEEMERIGAMTLRVGFMSQPVGRGMDLPFGRAMRDRFRGDFVSFQGYNRMTDGSISQHEGDLKSPYLDAPGLNCALKIDYGAIGRDVRAADAEGFRWALHAQGDAAVAQALDILETCRRDADGRLVLRHAITDLELTDPADLERMGRLGAVAEIYPQIMSLADRAGKTAMIAEKLGEDRGRYYWNRRKMVDSGVVLGCATDLPLMVDDIPQSIYHACGGLFPEGGAPFNPQNTLSVKELLTAWSRGGAYHTGGEHVRGTLEAGKWADIAVLDADVFTLPIEQSRGVKNCLTLVGGRVAYDGIQ